MIPEKIIPSQEEGSKTDIIETVTANSQEEANTLFEEAKSRLLKVYDWDKICALPSAVFILSDTDGSPVKRDAQVGDYFRIDIPGPGSSAGEGYDWVRVEKIEAEDNVNETSYLAIQVRPCSNPWNKDGNVAHFFDDDATSTFVVSLQDRTVTAEVHGRNEKANTSNEKAMDTVRNVLIGWGAKIGFSFPQWKSLVVGLLKTGAETK